MDEQYDNLGNQVENDIEDGASIAENTLNTLDMLDVLEQPFLSENEAADERIKRGLDNQKKEQIENADYVDQLASTGNQTGDPVDNDVFTDYGGNSNSAEGGTIGDALSETGDNMASELGGNVGAEVGETAGSAIGSAAGPLGTAVGKFLGGIIGKFIKQISFIAAFVIVFSFMLFLQFFAIVFDSWVPIVFNNATLIKEENRDDQMRNKMKDNFYQSAASIDDLSGVFKLIQNNVKAKKDELKKEDDSDSSTPGYDAENDDAEVKKDVDNNPYFELGSLIQIVNEDRPLPMDYIPSDLVTVESKYSVREISLRKEAAEAFKDMQEAAEKKQIKLYSVYGYQSPNDVSEELYGKAEHQSGLAIDVVSLDQIMMQLDILSETFASTIEGKWLKENAANYGFIFTYPKGSAYYEPWHIRYVGVETAKAIINSGKSFEEFSKVKEPVKPDTNKSDATEENWDVAYLVSAYSTSMDMYSKDSDKTFLQDMSNKIFDYIKNIFGHEVEFEKTKVTPVEYPTYTKKQIDILNDDGVKEIKTVYEYSGMEETEIELTLPMYREVWYNTILENDKEGGVTTKSLKYYEVDGDQAITYSPEVEIVKDKEKVSGAFKKSTVLVTLGLQPNEQYNGEKGLTKVSNAQYADYLRETLIKSIPIDEDETSTGNGSSIIGEYLWPLPDYVRKEDITSFFGYRPPGDTNGVGSTNHGGIDVGARTGTPILACADGIITCAGLNGGYGNCVIIDHQNSISTLYGHMSSIACSEGQQIKKGEVIGFVGSTGNSTGPHLHLTAMKDGVAFDPFELFTASQHPYGLRPESVYGIDGNVESWRAAVQNALQANGLEPRDDLVEKVLRQMTTESGGDSQVVQGIFDINSGSSIPFNGGKCPWCPSGSGESCKNHNIAHGLMQTIPTTFEMYKHEGHDNIFDGYDNLLASIAYMKVRYGPNLDEIGEGTGY